MTTPPPHPEDAELLRQSLAGKTEAFGLLYDRYARIVRAVFLGVTTDENTLHDLTQETFLRAYRNLSRLREPTRFGAWLVGTARLVVREKYRRQRRDRHQFVGDHDKEICQPDSVDQAEDVRLVLEQLAHLPEQERLAVQLFFLEENNAARTGELLNLSRSGVYAVLKRACERLARLVRKTELR